MEFSVASISHVVNNSKSFAWAPQLINLLKVTWDLRIPLKIKVFSWRFFIERIPSKDQLLKRVVINFTNPDCIFCGNHLENSYLFFHCQMAEEIWNHIFVWLGISEDIN